MADNTTTTNLGLIKVGRGNRNHDPDLNTNSDTLDLLVSSRSLALAVYEGSGGLTKGTPVQLSAASGSIADLQMTEANMSSGSHAPADGILLADVETDGTAHVARYGRLDVSGSIYSFTPGSIIYVGNATLESTFATAVSSSGAYQIAGYAIDEDTVMLSLRAPVYPETNTLPLGVEHQGGSITNSWANTWDDTAHQVYQEVTADAADSISLIYQFELPIGTKTYPNSSGMTVLRFLLDQELAGSVDCTAEIARVIDNLGTEYSTGLPSVTISSSPTALSLTADALPGTHAAGGLTVVELKVTAAAVGDKLRVLNGSRLYYHRQVEL